MNLYDKCYLLTSRDVLMPATLVDYTESGLAIVLSPDGRAYTANPANVYDEEAGRIMLYHRRAQELARQGYEIRVRNDGTFRVVNPDKHGQQGGYIVSGGENAMTCTCKAFEKSRLCKHIMGCTVLLWDKAREAREQGWKSGETRYTNLATKAA